MRRAVLILCAVILSSCASVPFNVLQVNSLMAEEPGFAPFEGLESLAGDDPQAGKRRVNIIFLHGIGWVENPDEKPLANAFMTGVADAYGLSVEKRAVSPLCGRSAEEDDLTLQNYIYINAPAETRYRTSIPGRQLTLDRLLCVDRQVLSVRDDLDYVIYRVFWDQIMWESLQYAHVGQDDNQGESKKLASLRRSLNRDLKDKFVNYGFSDAVMYLGPAGQEIRNAIRGAMCAAALEANGVSFSDLGHVVDYNQVCAAVAKADINIDRFAFVAESLGSKIALDVVRDAMTDGVETVHDVMIRNTQVFMLANQIPLLSLSDLSSGEALRPSDYAVENHPTFIAFSEINDFLTYELVPFYEQLYKYSDVDPAFASADQTMNTLDRSQLVNRLGFNAIDMRVEFAKPFIPLVSRFADPGFAHNGHVRQPEVMNYILCGSDGTKPRLKNCDVDRTVKP